MTSGLGLPGPSREKPWVYRRLLESQTETDARSAVRVPVIDNGSERIATARFKPSRGAQCWWIVLVWPQPRL